MFLNILEKVRRKGKGTKLIGNGCSCYGVVVVKPVLQIRVSQVAGNCKGEFEAFESYRKHI